MIEQETVAEHCSVGFEKKKNRRIMSININDFGGKKSI
jgi:hypothetical protein